MLCTNLIRQKRDGGELNAEQWKQLISGFCDGSVSREQMAAMAMAICIRGLSDQETAHLTAEMLGSGSRLPRVTDRPRVDKHSTGGLGDKVSLILAPLLAAAGCDVPMISGRGLGRTGGTLDKLESIDGFQTSLSIEQSSAVLRDVGAFIVGADESIAPADRSLYALRDVTATVESVGLITASILSKKLAASLDALVMDVKVGTGGFMPTLDEAESLATRIVQVAEKSGLPTTAVLSDMDQPLGEAVGNAIEVNETIAILQNQPRNPRLDSVRQLTIELAAHALVEVGKATDLDAGKRLLDGLIQNGRAYEVFEEMVTAQGGRLPTAVSGDPLRLERAQEITAASAGWVSHIDCPAIGDAIIMAGGGRRRGGEKLNHRVGVRMLVRIGDHVEKGQPLLRIHDDNTKMASPETWIQISDVAVPASPLIIKTLDASGHQLPPTV
ncbi:thymidine phosphorylase [Neorhodopirellula lusitana]|uniref:thymidine phosphorylase n=1 Tax=Neorhodopirellula lusitana TaxID=445327 RepID=UPI00385039EC